MPLELPSRNPGDFLAFVAENVTAGDPAAEEMIAEMAVVPTFFGMVLVVECWSNDEMTPDQNEVRRTPLADTVGSYESRQVCAVDIRGNVYGLHRKRGEKPEDFDGLTGRVIAALHVITLAVAERLPPGPGRPGRPTTQRCNPEP